MMILRNPGAPLDTKKQALTLLTHRWQRMMSNCEPGMLTFKVLAEILSLRHWEAVGDLNWSRFASHMLFRLLVSSNLDRQEVERQGFYLFFFFFFSHCFEVYHSYLRWFFCASAMDVDSSGASSSSPSPDPLDPGTFVSPVVRILNEDRNPALHIPSAAAERVDADFLVGDWVNDHRAFITLCQHLVQSHSITDALLDVVTVCSPWFFFFLPPPFFLLEF